MLNSQTGFIGFAVQALKGVHVAPSFFTKYLNDDIGMESETIIPDAEIGGGRDIADAYAGPTKVTGGMEFDVRTNFLGFGLYAVSGADTPTQVESGLVYSHVITPANELPWLSAQKKLSDTYDVYDYTDLKMNSLTLSCDAGKQLVGKFDIVGITESGNATPATTAYETGEVLMWHSAEIKIDNTTVCPKSVSIEINNNLEDDDFRICPTFGRGLGDLAEKRREVNISVTLRPEDNDFYQKANYGQSGANAPTKNIYKGSFWMKFESVNAITGEYLYSVILSIPHMFMKPFKVSPSGDDSLEHGLDMVAIKPSTDALYTATVQNSVDSYTA